MAFRLRRREGCSVNHKRVQQLWWRERPQRPTPPEAKGGTPRMARPGATGPNIPTRCGPWTLPIDKTAAGRGLRFLTVIDEHSRPCLASRVGRGGKVKGAVAVAVAVLENLTSPYPAPRTSDQTTARHCPGPTGLVRGHRQQQREFDRARIRVGERLCRVA